MQLFGLEVGLNMRKTKNRFKYPKLTIRKVRGRANSTPSDGRVDRPLVMMTHRTPSGRRFPILVDRRQDKLCFDTTFGNLKVIDSSLSGEEGRKSEEESNDTTTNAQAYGGMSSLMAEESIGMHDAVDNDCSSIWEGEDVLEKETLEEEALEEEALDEQPLEKEALGEEAMEEKTEVKKKRPKKLLTFKPDNAIVMSFLSESETDDSADAEAGYLRRKKDIQWTEGVGDEEEEPNERANEESENKVDGRYKLGKMMTRGITADLFHRLGTTGWNRSMTQMGMKASLEVDDSSSGDTAYDDEPHPRDDDPNNAVESTTSMISSLGEEAITTRSPGSPSHVWPGSTNKAGPHTFVSRATLDNTSATRQLDEVLWGSGPEQHHYAY